MGKKNIISEWENKMLVWKVQEKKEVLNWSLDGNTIPKKKKRLNTLLVPNVYTSCTLSP